MLHAYNTAPAYAIGVAAGDARYVSRSAVVASGALCPGALPHREQNSSVHRQKLMELKAIAAAQEYIHCSGSRKYSRADGAGASKHISFYIHHFVEYRK